MRPTARLAALVAIAVAAGAPACGDNRHVDAGGETTPSGRCLPQKGTSITFRQVATSVGAAMIVVSPPDDDRHFVVEQDGRIRILDVHGVYQPVTSAFLDITTLPPADYATAGEQGLLGLAFHPDYAHNRQFYVFYTTPDANVLARYTTRADDPDHADPASAQILLSIPDFAVNHNGGMMEFGADGFLYLGTGDGGGANDPHLNGQNPSALLGKMLRLDVDHPAGGKLYGIPADNPFADGVAGAPEVYVLGARNPWRWSFDRGTGDLWIGDVGQDLIEEVDVLRAGHIRGANLGWSMYEGNDCFHAPCDATGKFMPQFTAAHADGWCAMIGGEVYRGSCYPDLYGTYLFTDYCRRQLEEGTLQSDGRLVVREVPTNGLDMAGNPVPGFPTTPASLHADARGELYLTTQTCCGTSLAGGVFHIEAGP